MAHSNVKKVKKYFEQKIKRLNFCVFEKNQTTKMIKLDKVTLKTIFL